MDNTRLIRAGAAGLAVGVALALYQTREELSKFINAEAKADFVYRDLSEKFGWINHCRNMPLEQVVALAKKYDPNAEVECKDLLEDVQIVNSKQQLECMRFYCDELDKISDLQQKLLVTISENRTIIQNFLDREQAAVGSV